MPQHQDQRLGVNTDVVRDYLTCAFPDKQVEVVLEPEPARRDDRGFRIYDQRDFYFLNVPCEFLSESEAADVANYLDQWNVAQLLRDAGAHQVTVLKGEPPIRAD